MSSWKSHFFKSQTLCQKMSTKRKRAETYICSKMAHQIVESSIKDLKEIWIIQRLYKDESLFQSFKMFSAINLGSKEYAINMPKKIRTKRFLKFTDVCYTIHIHAKLELESNHYHGKRFQLLNHYKANMCKAGISYSRKKNESTSCQITLGDH